MTSEAQNNSTNGGAPADPEPDRRARARERSEAKNQAAREALEPLAPGERPPAVTVAAIVAALLTIGNLLAYAFNRDAVSHSDQGKALVQTVIICGILAAASIGMWRAKYWAVLGFQTILAFEIIIMCLLLTRATSVLAAILVFAIVIASGVLFWYLIRAMARIQMPESPEVKELRELRAQAEAEKAAAAEGDEKNDG